MAASAGVSPGTAAAAYRLLRERGVIETAGRRGTRVRARPASTFREEIRIEVPPGVRDLAKGNPDPRLLPPLHDALAAAARAHAERPAMYGTGDDEELLALAGQRLRADGVPAAPLAITSGTLDAVERVLTAHLRPGDAIAVEDPGWTALLDLVAVLGLRPVPMRLDDEGPLPEELARALRAGARAVVITARAQNPTGAAVSAARAAELRGLLGSTRRCCWSRTTTGPGSWTCRCIRWPGSRAAGSSSAPRPSRSGPTCAWPRSPAIRSRSTGCAGGSGWPPGG
ncbi:aminotransferase class I/II-fold pyridoxal phosphate-dependent enzyme [Nonomuraea rubra]|uniref:aminotransferase class I/II-fold pyridoxal phosphate-dependent enzyme n=1 Tax=Nonomuraea rubra TaxID=46180 RepID=UPI00361A8A7E